MTAVLPRHFFSGEKSGLDVDLFLDIFVADAVLDSLSLKGVPVVVHVHVQVQVEVQVQVVETA